MVLKALGLLALLLSSFKLGESQLMIHRWVAVATALLAVVLHIGVGLALPRDAVERIARPWVYTAVGSLVLIMVAAVESAGVWLPVAFVPWAERSARAWATLYLLAAAVLGAIAYYFPFDAVIVNGEIIEHRQPEYEVALVASLPFGIIGYVLGWRRGRSRTDASVRTA